MKPINRTSLLPAFLVTFLTVPAFATVTVASFTPSQKAPQPIGKTITWTATGTDSGSGQLAFQFWVTPPGGTAALVKDFNLGTLNGSTWTSHPFVWVPTGIEGAYKIQVVIKDFPSGQSNAKTVSYQVNAVVTGSTPIIEKTNNPLVALFSAPSCASGSVMRVAYQSQSGSSAFVTNWVPCHSPATMTFEVAGMYPSTAYNVHAQTKTNGTITNGPTLPFTTGALPKSISFPKFKVQVSGSDTTNPVILHTMIQPGSTTVYPDVATDLQGKVIWYYSANDLTGGDVLTRPLPGGGMITIQDDIAWDPNATKEQFLRQIDLAGNIIRETNMGIIQQQLIALGAVDGGPCSAIASPPPIGAGCAGAFHHDAIQTLPNGYTAALIDIEKIFPPGTQGNISTLPVDVIGDMIVVMDKNWQVKWYWDSFDPAGGGNGYSKLPVSQTAPLVETCGANTAGCPPIFLLGSSVAPLAEDWLHANTLYYWPNDGSTTPQPGDIIWSSRDQDFAFKIDYKDGTGTGNILWRMGYGGDFTMNNPFNDPYPWFSHQHDVGIENNGQGVMTVFDNGNTRISTTPPGLGSACHPYDCDSRGQAFTFSEGNMQVTPVANFDLGSYSAAMGSAQLLANGNFFFQNPLVLVNLNTTAGYSLEIGPTPAAPQQGPANILLDISGPEHYRGWQMPSLYSPPTT
jgi:arylsulfate sulfotransferase